MRPVCDLYEGCTSLRSFLVKSPGIIEVVFTIVRAVLTGLENRWETVCILAGACLTGSKPSVNESRPGGEPGNGICTSRLHYIYVFFYPPKKGCLGYLWLPLVTFGYLWLPLVTFGYLWLPLVTFGYLYLPIQFSAVLTFWGSFWVRFRRSGLLEREFCGPYHPAGFGSASSSGMADCLVLFAAHLRFSVSMRPSWQRGLDIRRPTLRTFCENFHFFQNVANRELTRIAEHGRQIQRERFGVF
jgi:hypothetical protein